MYNPFSLEGKTILVTGASSGIGKAATIECSKMGAKVIALGRNEERLKDALAATNNPDNSYIICDLANGEEVDEKIKEIDKIDGLINNAGIAIVKPFKFITEDDLNKMLAIDTVAPIMFLQKLVKKKKISRDGSVVFTSSLAALGGVSNGNSMYVACKGAISSFVQNAALELAPQGIRVNAVCPAMVNTPLIHDGDEENESNLKRFASMYPLRRFGEPEEIAWAMIYLLSDASKWITGTNVIIDGGCSLKNVG